MCKLQGYSMEQLEVIELGKKLKLDTSYYEDTNLADSQMWLVLKGLLNNLDVTKYNKPCYNFRQMNELLTGLKKNINIDCCLNPNLSANKMH